MDRVLAIADVSNPHLPLVPVYTRTPGILFQPRSTLASIVCKSGISHCLKKQSGACVSLHGLWALSLEVPLPAKLKALVVGIRLYNCCRIGELGQGFSLRGTDIAGTLSAGAVGQDDTAAL
jgi:hypothetical protein